MKDMKEHLRRNADNNGVFGVTVRVVRGHTLCKKAVIPRYNKCVCRCYSLVIQYYRCNTDTVYHIRAPEEYTSHMYNYCVTWFCNTDTVYHMCTQEEYTSRV